MKQTTLKNDILLILALLVLAGAAYGVLRLTREPGNEAAVTVDGQLVLTVPLVKWSETTQDTSRGLPPWVTVMPRS